MLAAVKIFIFISLSVLFTAVALLIPYNLRSVDSAVVELSGNSGRSPEERIQESIYAADTGPAIRLLKASASTSAEYVALSTRIDTLNTERPIYRISGGADPYFEDFLNLVQIETAKAPAGVIPLLLPRSERASLIGLLENSRNAAVISLLEARNLNGLIRLHPANHPAGAPYDSGVLTLALLVEGGHFPNRLAQEIGLIASQASRGATPAISAMEDLVIATLSLGRVLEFKSLTNLAEISKTPTDWAQMGALFRSRPKKIDTLFTALVFSEAPFEVFKYLANFDETGLPDLEYATRHGPQALTFLFESDLPIFRPAPAAAGAFLERFEPMRPRFFTQLTLQAPWLALLLKLLLLLLSGLSIVFALSGVGRLTFKQDSKRRSRFDPIARARDAFVSVVLVGILWTVFEPELLKSKDESVDSAPRIQFAVADTLESLKTPVKAMQDLNQVTLLVLALFFVLQLAIYTFCLIKLKEVAKQKVSPMMKIRLLENEENLFDFGLYVGLGGTVLSLILVAVGVVEASLMAAYASTLFGILFTAILKVAHLRPYRRQLILESGSNATSPDGELMKNIKL